MKKEIIIVLASIFVLFVLFNLIDSWRIGKVENRIKSVQSRIESVQEDMKSIHRNIDESMQTLDFSLKMIDSSYGRITKDNEAFRKEFGRLQLNIQTAKQQLEKVQKIDIPSIKDY